MKHCSANETISVVLSRKYSKAKNTVEDRKECDVRTTTDSIWFRTAQKREIFIELEPSWNGSWNND